SGGAARKPFLSSGPSARTRRRKMCVAAVLAHRRDLIDEQAREQRLHVGPGHRFDGFCSRREAENRRLLGDALACRVPLAAGARSPPLARTSGTGTSTRLRAPHSPHSKVIQWSRTAPV